MWPYQLNQMKCQYYEQHFEEGVKDGFYPALPEKESGAKVSENDDFTEEEAKYFKQLMDDEIAENMNDKEKKEI